MNLNPAVPTSAEDVIRAVDLFGTPAYIYDERTITANCKELLAAAGNNRITVRYAMKANSSRAVLQLVSDQGLKIDASSMEEVERALAAGIQPADILLTGQSVPSERDLFRLEKWMTHGLLYTICSLRQLRRMAPLVEHGRFPVYCRIHPGSGSGESQSRDTGSPYSCFGIHSVSIQEALELIDRNSLNVQGVHIHIGSGSDPEVWQQTVSKGLTMLSDFFTDASVLNLGGGFRIARMPQEDSASVKGMVQKALCSIEQFSSESGRVIELEVEPGTFVVANAGFLAAEVMDIKSTGADGCEFVLLNAGMDANSRPALYGSNHPFYVLGRRGEVKFSEFRECRDTLRSVAVSGRCCETGDSQTIDSSGIITPRMLPLPSPGDIFAVGGCGAYCSSMALSGYNSSLQLREILIRQDGNPVCIRERQSIQHLTANELDLPETLTVKEENDRYTC